MSKIVILDSFTTNPGDLDWDDFEQLGELVLYDRSDSTHVVVERAAGADIILTNKTVINRNVLDQLPDLKYIGVLATGVNVVDLDAASEKGIVVTNVPGYSTDSVAQHVFAMLLELAGLIQAHDGAVRDGEWEDCPDFSFTTGTTIELSGKTLGIVGLGSIGRKVAQVGHALGMKIAAAHQRSMNDVSLPGIEIDWLPVDELFAVADVLTLHCPLTPDTEKLVNANRLASMKPTAWLINTGRGALVDEEALADALNRGILAGAGLDVLSTEPPKPENPLLSARNTIITPHIAWATREARQRLMNMACANIAAFLDGAPVNVVNPVHA
jgi:glycerate dehydrogenase